MVFASFRSVLPFVTANSVMCDSNFCYQVICDSNCCFMWSIIVHRILNPLLFESPFHVLFKSIFVFACVGRCLQLLQSKSQETRNAPVPRPQSTKPNIPKVSDIDMFPCRSIDNHPSRKARFMLFRKQRTNASGIQLARMGALVRSYGL